MADQTVTPQALSWKRNADGRVQITVAVQVQTAPGSPVFSVPIHTFVLTQDEEHGLLTLLSGVAIAHELPKKLELVK